MIDGCGDDFYSRGLCKTHYQYIANMILRGKAEWGMFIEKEICLEKCKTRKYRKSLRIGRLKLLTDMMLRKGL